MKIVLLFLVLFSFASCGISDDCIKSSGSAAVRQLEASSFDKIVVYPGISLEVTQGDEYNVTISAGENFISGIDAKIENGTLTVKDNSGCNWVRKYGQTVVHVTAPNIIEIYSNTDRDIRSNGILTFPVLRLYAMDSFGGVGTGNFHINANNEQLVIESNNIAAFFIEGATNQLLLNFYDDMGRFEGENFLANSVVVFQRSSNDMIVHPVESLTGNIYSTGNLISVTHPPTVNVVEHYTGRLIFN